MTFSVIIPAFNAEATIIRTLQSCIRQTHAPLEIIVVDDASSDRTVQLVQNMGTRVRLIQLPENKGVANARNIGWDAAKGDYIAFLDSDDTWAPDKLQVLDFYLTENKSLPLIFHPYTLNDLIRKEDWEKERPRRYSFRKLLWSNAIQSSCLCLSKSVQMRFNTDFRYCEDHELALRIAFKYECYQIPFRLTRLYAPQLLGHGLSENLWKMRMGEMKMYSRLWQLHILFLPLIPFFLALSLIKHIYKWLAVKSGLEYQMRKRN